MPPDIARSVLESAASRARCALPEQVGSPVLRATGIAHIRLARPNLERCAGFFKEANQSRRRSISPGSTSGSTTRCESPADRRR